jgi:hypothetical protein
MKEEFEKEEKYCDNVRGGTLFGDPEIRPKRSYRCQKHGLISTAEIEWQDMVPHCPRCGRTLEVSASKTAKS